MSTETQKPELEVIAALSLERETLTEALQDALCFYDRVTGILRGDGWTAAETVRLAEIRALAYGHPADVPVPANWAPAGAQTPPASYAKRSEGQKTPEIGS
jgi:hypothetical protein